MMHAKEAYVHTQTQARRPMNRKGGFTVEF